MKHVVLYGNCQISVIEKILQALYADELKIFILPLIHKITDVTYFDTIQTTLVQADFIILQNNKEHKKDPFIRIFPFLKKEAKVIFIPSLYNSTYSPELIKINTIPPLKFGVLHDINILKAYLDEIPLKDFLISDPFYKDDFYDNGVFSRLLDESLKNLKEKESILKKKIGNENYDHIGIIPYLLDSYSHNSQILWADFNHPKLPVYHYLIKKIIHILALPFKNKLFDEVFNPVDFLPINRPSYLSTLNFFHSTVQDWEQLYRLGNNYREKKRSTYVDDAYTHYDTFDGEQIESVKKKLNALNR